MEPIEEVPLIELGGAELELAADVIVYDFMWKVRIIGKVRA